MTNLTNIAFDSRLNYLKRQTSGSTNLTLPTAGAAIEYTINHNLGYVPFFIVGAEQTDTTTIWSGNRVYEDIVSSASITNKPVQLEYYCDDTTLTIRLINGSGTGDQVGQIRTVYWIVYRDYL